MNKDDIIENLAQAIRLVLLDCFADHATDLDDAGILSDEEMGNAFNSNFLKLGIDSRCKLHVSAWIDEIGVVARRSISDAIDKKMKNMISKSPIKKR